MKKISITLGACALMYMLWGWRYPLILVALLVGTLVWVRISGEYEQLKQRAENEHGE